MMLSLLSLALSIPGCFFPSHCDVDPTSRLCLCRSAETRTECCNAYPEMEQCDPADDSPPSEPSETAVTCEDDPTAPGCPCYDTGNIVYTETGCPLPPPPFTEVHLSAEIAYDGLGVTRVRLVSPVDETEQVAVDAAMHVDFSEEDWSGDLQSTDEYCRLTIPLTRGTFAADPVQADPNLWWAVQWAPDVPEDAAFTNCNDGSGERNIRPVWGSNDEAIATWTAIRPIYVGVGALSPLLQQQIALAQQQNPDDEFLQVGGVLSVPIEGGLPVDGEFVDEVTDVLTSAYVILREGEPGFTAAPEGDPVTPQLVIEADQSLRLIGEGPDDDTPVFDGEALSPGYFTISSWWVWTLPY